MSQQVTIKDVAERAGCGVATVSRVLNDTGPASAEARARVLEAVEALGFEFNEIGRSLQSNRTRTIGCLVPSLINPVFADAVQAAQAEALSRGYHLLLTCSNYDPALETEAIRMLLQKKVDGMVLTVSDAAHSDGLELVRERGLRHCLMFNAPVGSEAAFYVDNNAASLAVAEAFAKAGHRHTGFVALRFNASDRSRQRFEGFRDACLSLGMAEPALLEIDETQHDLRERLHRLLDDNTALTGLFASNDFLALAAIRTARRLGRRIPRDLSVIGFDGIAVGEMVEPDLATIVTDARAMGGHATAALLDAIANDTDPAAPETGLAFSFRPGGSLGAPVSGKDDGGRDAAPPPPLNHPAKDRTVNQEQ